MGACGSRAAEPADVDSDSVVHAQQVAVSNDNDDEADGTKAPLPPASLNRQPTSAKLLQLESNEGPPGDTDAEKMDWILKLLQGQRSNAYVAAKCLEKLALLVGVIEANRAESLQRGALPATVRAMRVHASEPKVQAWGCAMVANLAEGPTSSLFSGGAVEVVVNGMVHHSDDADVRELGCCALRNICRTEALRAEATKAGAKEAWLPAKQQRVGFAAEDDDGKATTSSEEEAPKRPRPLDRAPSAPGFVPPRVRGDSLAKPAAPPPSVLAAYEASAVAGEAPTAEEMLEELFRAVDAGDIGTTSALLGMGGTGLDVNGSLVDTSWTDAARKKKAAAQAAGTSAKPSLSRATSQAPAHVTPLLLAVRLANIDMIDALLQGGADPNVQNSTYPPVLTLAAFSGDEAILDKLLSHGAQVDARDSRGATALIAASFGGRVGIMRRLLEHEADVAAQAKDSMHALAAAAFHGNLEAINLLLEHGADPNLAAAKKATPTMLAVQSGSWQAVMRLVEAGGDPDRQDARGETALDYASAHVKAKQKKRELDAAKADELLENMQTALGKAPPKFGANGRERSDTGHVSSAPSASARSGKFSARESSADPKSPKKKKEKRESRI